MDRRFSLPLVIAIGVISILVGLAIGAVFLHSPSDGSSDSNDNKDNQSDNKVILRSESLDEADSVWDPEHHSLLNLEARIEGRVIMIEMAVEDEEEQYHFLLLPDLDFRSMVNDENVAQLRGAVMIEIMKVDDFIIPSLFIGQHLEVQGPLVTDFRDGHGWNEIDPALIITEK